MFTNIATLVLLISVTIGLCKAQAFYPSSLNVQSGTNSDTSLTALNTKDQSGSQDDWNKYVEFYGSSAKYQGIFSFPVTISSASAYSLSVNFRGPKKTSQVWQFEWYEQATGSYVFAGDNTAAADWAWSSLSFTGTLPFSSLVSSSNIVQVRFSSTTKSDDCDLDFLQLSLSSTSTSPPTSAPTSKPTSAPTPKPTSSPPTSSPPTSSPPTSSPPTSSPGGKFCPSGTHYRPGPYTTWQWQLSGTVDTSVNVQLYDIDMFEASTTLINSLHAQGRAVTCYIDTAYEPGRPDSAQFTSAVLGNGIDGWPGQKWVDIRATLVRNIIANRIALAASKQCDAVEMDDVDAYQNNPGFPLTAQDQINFNTFLASTAHANGLGIALKNDLDQVSTLASSFDFAVNEQCFEYDECDVLSTFINQGKAVFGVEYDLATTQFCPQANSAKFSWLKKDLDLDASRTQCCTTNCGGQYSCVAN